MRIEQRLLLIAAAAALIAAPKANAATATAQLNVQVQITAECVITSAPSLNFGTSGVIGSNINATTALGVQCTSGTPYAVALDQGGGVGATITARLLTGPAAQTIQYALYRDSARTLNWGKTVGTDTLAGTGSGASQPITVYGQIAPQTTPGVGTYTDQVVVTVTY